jgi:predicted nuclease of predicted toxin-antitoxin system
MIRFLADENFNGKIIRGLRARNPLLDILRWQDIGREGEDDPEILEWAAAQGRVLLTHDADTMPGFVYERVTSGLSMPGIIVVNTDSSFRTVIEDLLLIGESSLDGEFENQVIYVPL